MKKVIKIISVLIFIILLPSCNSNEIEQLKHENKKLQFQIDLQKTRIEQLEADVRELDKKDSVMISQMFRLVQQDNKTLELIELIALH